MPADSVTLYELNALVRSVLEQTMSDAYWLEAELSEARLASNGHFYVEFVEKDSSGRSFIAKARGTIWARTYHTIAPLFEHATGERLRAGMKVRVQVTVSFHELYGYSLNVIDIDPTYTLGDMARRRREILEQLEADGILHDNQELELPSLLKRIAIVSSAGAAGYGDFCNQLENNDYGLAFHLQLFPAVMQGEHVEESVLAALAAIADEADRWDCAVIIRGGGATSDLSDFDSYHLAAAITQMPLPVIVGIGHERDETVLDFVAHTRVKTPTAAAAFLINHGAEQLARLNTLQDRIMQMPRLQLQAARERLTRLQTLLPRTVAMTIERERHKQQQLSQRFRHTPLLRVQSSRLTAQSLEVRIANAAKLKVQSSKFKVQSLETRLAALDPALQLRRGFSLTYSSDGHLLRSIADIRPGDTITTRLADGDVAAVTTSVQNTQHNR